ncbi:MAG: thioesterase [Eubacteriales bacterium]|nr:thioesterase [Eubacteriales bacterium]
MYTFDSRVRYSETDEDARLTLESMIDYMQDCTNFQSEDLGVGLEYHRERQIMWVLNFWQIVIDEYPRMGEWITVGTQSFGFEKMFGHRNFLITQKDAPEKRVAVANSLWVLMDLQKGRPMIVSPEIGEVYGVHEPLPMEYASRKIKVPGEGGEARQGFVVKEYHLDTNHHVNNGQYVRMALEALAEDFVVRELRVEYRKQAVLGDEITPVIYCRDQERLVALNGSDGKPYAVVQFFIK